MSTIKVTNIQDTSGGNQSTSEQLAQGRAKAWINFDGTGSITINDDFNVNSITDQGAGEFDIVFETAMSNANYAVAALTSINSNQFKGIFERKDGTTRSASSFRITQAIQSATQSGKNAGEADNDLMSIIVFGD